MTEPVSSLHDLGALGQAHYAHGTRQNYRAGCKCTPCRSANACYEAQRAHREAHEARTVPATAAKAHLEMLQRIGIGHRQAAKLAQVSFRTVQRIRTGRARQIRADVARKILSIERPFLAQGVYVNGYETRHYVESLQREGFTRSWLARMLGLHAGRLRVGAKVRVGRALRMRALYQRLTAE